MKLATTIMQSSGAEPQPVVVEGNFRHLQFLVQDAGKAWDCAMDIESWIRVMSAGAGTLTRVSGNPGTLGVSYMRSQTIISGGLYTMVHQTHTFEKYTLVVIDKTNQKLTFNVETQAGIPQQLFITIEPTNRPDRLNLVRFTETKIEMPTIDNILSPCFGFQLCCLFQANTNSMLGKLIEAAEVETITRVGRLRNHFELYVPKDDVGDSVGDIAQPINFQIY